METRLNFVNATMEQLKVITEFEDCPMLFKTCAQDEINRRNLKNGTNDTKAARIAKTA